MEPETIVKTAPRLRVGFNQNSKGAVQRDVTAEADDPALIPELLRKGLDALDTEVKRLGLKYADQA